MPQPFTLILSIAGFALGMFYLNKYLKAPEAQEEENPKLKALRIIIGIVLICSGVFILYKLISGI